MNTIVEDDIILSNFLTEGWLEKYGVRNFEISSEVINSYNTSEWLSPALDYYYSTSETPENIDEIYDEFLKIQNRLIEEFLQESSKDLLEVFIPNLHDRLEYLLKLLILINNDNP